MSILRGPKNSKAPPPPKTVIILTDGNFKIKHETEYNESIIRTLEYKDDFVKPHIKIYKAFIEAPHIVRP
jgi:hypothetical protein